MVRRIQGCYGSHWQRMQRLEGCELAIRCSAKVGLIIKIAEVETFFGKCGKPRCYRLAINLQADRKGLQGFRNHNNHVLATCNSKQFGIGAIATASFVDHLLSALTVRMSNCASPRNLNGRVEKDGNGSRPTTAVTSRCRLEYARRPAVSCNTIRIVGSARTTVDTSRPRQNRFMLGAGHECLREFARKQRKDQNAGQDIEEVDCVEGAQQRNDCRCHPRSIGALSKLATEGTSP